MLVQLVRSLATTSLLNPTQSVLIELPLLMTENQSLKLEIQDNNRFGLAFLISISFIQQ